MSVEPAVKLGELDALEDGRELLVVGIHELAGPAGILIEGRAGGRRSGQVSEIFTGLRLGCIDQRQVKPHCVKVDHDEGARSLAGKELIESARCERSDGCSRARCLLGLDARRRRDDRGRDERRKGLCRAKY